MLKPIIWRATVVAMLAMVVATPGIGLAEEQGPRQPSAQHDGRVPPKERARSGRQPGRPGEGQDANRPEARRCAEAVREHDGDKDDMRRCLAEAHQDEVTRPEVRRCAEAVREHDGDKDDMRRCLAEAHQDEVTRPEARRCAEAVREHGGNRDDLRRCLAMAHDKDGEDNDGHDKDAHGRDGHDDDAPASTGARPSSLLDRSPEPDSLGAE